MKYIYSIFNLLLLFTALGILTPPTKAQSPQAMPTAATQSPSPQSSQTTAPPSATETQQANNLSVIDIVIRLATLVFFVVSVLSALYQIRANQQWNRKKASHDFLVNYILEKVTEKRRSLEASGVKVYDSSQTYKTLIQSIEENPDLTEEKKKINRQNRQKLDADLRDLLNYLEHMAVAIIEENILDEPLAFKTAQAIAIGYYRWAEEYIKDMRKSAKAPGAWKNLEDLVVKNWEPKKLKEDAKIKEEEDAKKRKEQNLKASSS